MTGFLALVAALLLFTAAAAACTRSIARRHGRGRP